MGHTGDPELGLATRRRPWVDRLLHTDAECCCLALSASPLGGISSPATDTRVLYWPTTRSCRNDAQNLTGSEYVSVAVDVAQGARAQWWPMDGMAFSISPMYYSLASGSNVATARPGQGLL